MGFLPVLEPQDTLKAQWLKAPGILSELMVLRPGSKQGPAADGAFVAATAGGPRRHSLGWALLVGQASPQGETEQRPQVSWGPVGPVWWPACSGGPGGSTPILGARGLCSGTDRPGRLALSAPHPVGA